MEKKFGLYTTIDPEVISELSEIDVWKNIYDLGGALFWARHDAGRPWASNYSDETIMNAQYNLEFLVYYTRNYGVTFSREPSATEHVERSESYDAWYRFWNEWYNDFYNNRPEEWDQFVDDKVAGLDISKYLPTGSWKDLLGNSRKLD